MTQSLIIILGAVFLANGGFLLDWSFRSRRRVPFQMGGIFMLLGVLLCFLLQAWYPSVAFWIIFLILSVPTSVGYILSGWWAS